MGEFGGRKVKEEMYNYILVSEIKEKKQVNTILQMSPSLPCDSTCT